MNKSAGEIVRAQAAALRGVELGEERARQIAADIANITAAANAVRERLDFNDEPARFTALLCAPLVAPAKARRK